MNWTCKGTRKYHYDITHNAKVEEDETFTVESVLGEWWAFMESDEHSWRVMSIRGEWLATAERTSQFHWCQSRRWRTLGAVSIHGEWLTVTSIIPGNAKLGGVIVPGEQLTITISGHNQGNWSVIHRMSDQMIPESKDEAVKGGKVAWESFCLVCLPLFTCWRSTIIAQQSWTEPVCVYAREKREEEHASLILSPFKCGMQSPLLSQLPLSPNWWPAWPSLMVTSVISLHMVYSGPPTVLGTIWGSVAADSAVDFVSYVWSV